jgi:hypothetical protein
MKPNTLLKLSQNYDVLLDGDQLSQTLLFSAQSVFLVINCDLESNGNGQLNCRWIKACSLFIKMAICVCAEYALKFNVNDRSKKIMIQTLPAREITLHELREKFGLQLVENRQFFPEWQDDLPGITEVETHRLDRVKASYSNLFEDPPLLENTVKMVVLSPLLDLAGFYLPPFRIRSEKSIEMSLEDGGIIIKGQIDVLAICSQFWVVVIESKQAAFSLEVGRSQLLTYMLANPYPDRPTYGLILNGSSFRFLKLVKGESCQYATSRIFDLFNPGKDLYEVLRILKRLAQLAITYSI